MQLIRIKKIDVVLVEGGRQICLLDVDGNLWVYLTRVFGNLARVQKLKERYVEKNYRFVQTKNFETFDSSTIKVKYFGTLNPDAFFLLFEDFQLLAASENRRDFANNFAMAIQGWKEDFSLALPKLPKPGYIYIVSFPTRNLGKFGATSNWERRKKDLPRFYQAPMKTFRCNYSLDAWGLEGKIRAWLKTKDALVSVSSGPTENTKETFDCTKISPEQVCFFLTTQLKLEIAEPAMGQEFEKLLLLQAKTEPEVAAQRLALQFQRSLKVLSVLPSETKSLVITSLQKNPETAENIQQFALEVSGSIKTLPEPQKPKKSRTRRSRNKERSEV